jgi:hypothetical protein
MPQSMTPEERATEVARDFAGEVYWHEADAIDAIAAAIRAAIAEEREACAQVAEAQPPGYCPDDVAAAIRARGEP